MLIYNIESILPPPLSLYIIYISTDIYQQRTVDQVWAPQLLYTYFYNHDAHRLRLEKLLYLEPSRSSNGFFKPLLGPDGGFRSETAVTRRFRK
jgi:hypothetical protein